MIENLIEDLVRTKQVNVRPFFYSWQYLAAENGIAIGTTGQKNISIQSDSHFLARYINLTSYDSPGFVVSTVLAPLLINLFDSGTGQTLLDSAQPIQNLTGGAVNANGGGGGNGPFILPEPWLLVPSAVATVTLSNISTTRSLVRVDISLIGFKIYAYGTTRPYQGFSG